MVGMTAVGMQAVGLGAMTQAVQAPPADTTLPLLPGPITLSAVTTSGAHAAWPAGSDNVGVVGYEISIDTGTPLWVDLGNVLSCDISGKASGTAYTVRVRDYDAAGNRSTPITAPLTTNATTTGTGGTVTVPASRTARFTGSQRVAVFNGSKPVTLTKGALDELFYASDISKDLTDAATTAASVIPILPAGSGVIVLEGPEIQSNLITARLGGTGSIIWRVTCANGEQIDHTLILAALDDRTHTFGKDPDDKRFYAFDFSEDAKAWLTSLTPVQAPVVAGVTSLAAPTTQGNLAIVKIGGLDEANKAVNSCTATAILANGEKLVRSIYFNAEDH